MAHIEKLIPEHGGYRHLKSFQLAQLIYDITVRFAERYVERESRTRDQIVQAARSGVQNIAEASQASGTSKKMELKLTNVARASLEELRLDDEDFLRHRGFALMKPNDAILQRFKARRCGTLEQFRSWIADERTRTDTDGHRRTAAELAANGALSLLNICCYLLDRQLVAQATAFVDQGGFTERLYRIRTLRKNRS
jgi:four helix bundle suffix protein